MSIASLAVLAAEGANADVNPVLPDNPGEIFWSAVGFFSLWILMRYWLLPPLLRVRAQRREQELADRQAAAAAEEQAEQVRRDYDATLAEARAEAHRMLEESRAAAEQERGRRISEVEAELAAERQAAMAELETARSAAVAGLGGDVADLAVAAASKVVDTPLDPSNHRSTVESYVEDAR